MSSTNNKKCKICLIEYPLTNFYKNRGEYLKSSCKTCYNKKRYDYKVGYKKLTPEQIIDIKQRLKKGEKKAQIASFHKVKVGTFYGWIRKGKFN